MHIRAPCGKGPPQLPTPGAVGGSRWNFTPPGDGCPLVPDRMVPRVAPVKMFVDKVTLAVALYCVVLMLPWPTKTVLDEPSVIPTKVRFQSGALGLAAFSGSLR